MNVIFLKLSKYIIVKCMRSFHFRRTNERTNDFGWQLCLNSHNVSIRSDSHLSGFWLIEKLVQRNVSKHMVSLGKLSSHRFWYLAHIWSILVLVAASFRKRRQLFIYIKKGAKWMASQKEFFAQYISDAFFSCYLCDRDVIYLLKMSFKRKILTKSSFPSSAHSYMKQFLALNSRNDIIWWLIDANCYYDCDNVCVSELRAYYRKCIINDIRTACKATVIYVAFFIYLHWTLCCHKNAHVFCLFIHLWFFLWFVVVVARLEDWNICRKVAIASQIQNGI